MIHLNHAYEKASSILIKKNNVFFPYNNYIRKKLQKTDAEGNKLRVYENIKWKKFILSNIKKKKNDTILKEKRDLPLICRSMRLLYRIFYNEIITVIFVEYTNMKIKSFLKYLFFDWRNNCFTEFCFVLSNINMSQP